MTLDRDRFHRAARDGYLDLLRDATRKDCNTPDEDGMTPTLWAAYYGNLDALRLIVGRGGDPDRCDHYGNTALHWAAANGHMNCVSFLVNFGVSLWSLDNDFHTASNVAAINQRDEILRYLDDVVARQSALNKKLVQKLKEKSVIEAEKRIKTYQKLQRKAAKKAEKEEKEIEKQRRKIFGSELQLNGHKQGSITIQTLKREAQILYASPKYSDIISNGAGTTKKGLGAVSKRVQQKKQTTVMTAADFKVRECETNGKRSVRSLSGLLRDSEVLYVPKFDTQSTASGHQPQNHRRHLKDVFDNKSELSRAISEPDFLHTTDSGFGDEIAPAEPASIFERPGFGSVAFRNSMSGTLMSLPSTSTDENEDEEDIASNHASEKDSDPHNGSVEDSIGSAGSLAHRNNHMTWDDDEGHFDEEEMDRIDASPLVVFLVAHGLMEYVTALTNEKIDLDSLMLLTEEDLKHLGLPLGPRRKLLKAVEVRKSAIDDPGELLDSRL